MSNYYNAFEMSPVPQPSEDAVPPEPFRGIYGMPMFVTISTVDLASSEEFWGQGLGFFNLFAIPDRFTHLRRWAFQDVLLVPTGEETDVVPTATVSFACVLSEIDTIAAACEKLRPGCTRGPTHTPWNTVDVEIITPENVKVVFTAAKPLEPNS